jgi:molybdenum-dependent DNA-binding transcriptional regulator ModE
MSGKERKRLVILAGIKKGELSVAEGGRVMGVCYRQAKRIWRRYQKAGDAGLVHGSRGKAGGRGKKSAFRRKVLARYEARYPDFGPTLAAEKLQEEGLRIDHETLRRWLLEKGLWSVRRPGRKHRAWRERKECFGQMVQLDGSHHDWFEGRGERAVLMVMVDDATNRTEARFFEEETTRASYDVLEGWIQKYGVPGSLYVDRDSIYRCERVPSVPEQIAGKEPRTQFGRAMDQLGVELILANSPQAKGRVERRNGLLQDRLVKEMRLAGINDLEGANVFLKEQYLAVLNAKFNVEARSAADVHRKAPMNLAEMLSWEEERVVGKDWTVVWNGRWFQIQSEHERLGLADRKVTVRKLRCGMVQCIYEGKKLRWKELPERPAKGKPEPRKIGRTQLIKPAKTHPWRQGGIGVGKKFWQQEKARGSIAKRARHQASAASGQPSLRSAALQRHMPDAGKKTI